MPPPSPMSSRVSPAGCAGWSARLVPNTRSALRSRRNRGRQKKRLPVASGWLTLPTAWRHCSQGRMPTATNSSASNAWRSRRRPSTAGAGSAGCSSPGEARRSSRRVPHDPHRLAAPLTVCCRPAGWAMSISTTAPSARARSLGAKLATRAPPWPPSRRFLAVLSGEQPGTGPRHVDLGGRAEVAHRRVRLGTVTGIKSRCQPGREEKRRADKHLHRAARCRWMPSAPFMALPGTRGSIAACPRARSETKTPRRRASGRPSSPPTSRALPEPHIPLRRATASSR